MFLFDISIQNIIKIYQRIFFKVQFKQDELLFNFSRESFKQALIS